MKKISVVIPFFQREKGILRRALASVYEQIIPPGWQVDIVIVDDGSPVSAKDEVEGLPANTQIQINLMSQVNGGVAAARNKALDAADPATILIAFLDSDDIWPARHLSRAIDAYDAGYDFYFCDNSRKPHHTSYCKSCAFRTYAAIQAAIPVDGFVELASDDMVGFVVEEFPTQASTVVYAKQIYPELRFDTNFQTAGEDVLFFVPLVSRATRICFDTETTVECGDGINMFFGNFGWDSPKFLSIKRDQVRCHTLISKLPFLSRASRKYNKEYLNKIRTRFAFHSLRYTIKNKGKIPEQIIYFAKHDRSFFIWYPLSLFQILIGYPLGLYKP